ncbi:MAG TPA: phosphoribosylamine--glycine ligase [Polyangiaceae bacterium]|nr:phosphoribosylamine--glycine ligase [Polyangiaceae bacterium]
MARRARVIVVGSGAREHALSAALAASEHDVIIAPGNAGTEGVGRNVAVRADDVGGLVGLATGEGADLVVVGPELPLVLGLVDALEARGVSTFGPCRAAAQLEASKVFMKRFCKRHGIPTAAFAVFDDPTAAEKHLRQHALGQGEGYPPLVVKADGLAAGKGVVVADTVDEACAAVDRIMRKREFGDAGRLVVLEERLAGEEASFHVVCDGARAVALAAARDHKRVGDGDRGPNTGGMGAYAPAGAVTPEVHAIVMRDIVEPTLSGMAAEGAPFRGVLFVGLMIERGIPRVLEYNVRFGDPEATVLVPMYDGDWFELLEGAALGDVSRARAGTARGAAMSVVMAAAGYPGKLRTGDPIEGLDAPLASGAFVRHAGTARAPDGRVITSGGRVLAVGAHAATLDEAARSTYAAVARIHWEGEHHRRDIGPGALPAIGRI